MTLDQYRHDAANDTIFSLVKVAVNAYYFISISLKSGQININQTIPEKGKILVP